MAFRRSISRSGMRAKMQAAADAEWWKQQEENASDQDSEAENALAAKAQEESVLSELPLREFGLHRRPTRHPSLALQRAARIRCLDAGANTDGKVPVVVSIYLTRRRLVVHRGGDALEWLPPTSVAQDKVLLGTGGRALGPQHQARIRQLKKLQPGPVARGPTQQYAGEPGDEQARGRIREGGRGYHLASPGTPPPPGGGVSASTRSRMFPLRLQRLPV